MKISTYIAVIFAIVLQSCSKSRVSVSSRTGSKSDCSSNAEKCSGNETTFNTTVKIDPTTSQKIQSKSAAFDGFAIAIPAGAVGSEQAVKISLDQTIMGDRPVFKLNVRGSEELQKNILVTLPKKMTAPYTVEELKYATITVEAISGYQSKSLKFPDFDVTSDGIVSVSISYWATISLIVPSKEAIAETKKEDTGTVISGTTTDQISVSGLSASTSNATSLTLTASGTNFAYYRYVLRSDADAASCVGATYPSTWTAISTSISLSSSDLGSDGNKALCVLGKKSNGDIQTTSTRLAWIYDKTAPTVDAGVDVTSSTSFTPSSSSSETGTYLWTDVGNTGNITFGSATAVSTTVSASVDGTYTLKLTVTDAAGNVAFDTVQYIKDSTVPTVSAGSNVTVNAQTTLTGTVSGAVSVQWSKFAGTGTITFGTATASSTTVSASADGTYTLRLTATNALGNSSTSDMTFVWDTDPPTVSVGADVTSNAQITKTATVSGAATYLWSKTSGSGTITFGTAAASSTTISASADDTYVIRLTATDTAGNSAYDEFTLVVDTAAPTVDTGVDVTANASITKNATVSGATSYLWSKTSGAGTLTFGTATASSTTISASADATYVVRLTATDDAGNSTSDEFTLTWDATAPSVAVGADVLSGIQFSVTPTVSGGSTYQWTKQSGPGTVTFGTATTANTTVNADTDGVYVLRLTVTDGASNSAYDELTFTRDTTLPTVNAGSDATVNASTTITGTSSGATTYQWTKQAGAGTITFGSSTALGTTVSASADGAYTLRLTATTAAGMTASDDMTFTWDTTGPGAFSISSPSGTTYSLTPTVAWGASAGASTYNMKIMTASSCSGTAEQTYTALGTTSQALTTLALGTYYICVDALDSLGNITSATNTASASFTVAVDNTGPSVTSVTSSTTNGTYATGTSVSIQVQFSEVATLGGSNGTVALKLETGSTDRYAYYASGTGTDTWTFTYVVKLGDSSADLDVHASGPQLVLTGNRTIRDAVSNDATLTVGGTSLATNKALVISTATPIIGLDPADYNGDGTPNSGSIAAVNTTTWTDGSGNSKNGTLTNFNFAGASGWDGDGTAVSNPYRLKFDGTNDYVAVTTAVIKSISVWFNPTSVTAGSVLGISGWNTSIDISNGMLNYQYNGSPLISAGVVAGTWYHAVIVNNGTTNYYYLNGNLVGSAASNGALTTQSLTLGYYSAYFNGAIGNLKAYNSVLNSGDVFTLYENDRSKFITNPGTTQIDGIYPSVGSTAGGTSVVIRGWNFTGANSVTFGGVAAASYTVDSDYQITAVTPAASFSTVTVAVASNGATSSKTNAFTFTGVTQSNLRVMLDPSNIDAKGTPASSSTTSDVWSSIGGNFGGVKLSNFALPMSGASGWDGDGTVGSPYRLKFDGTNDIVRLSTYGTFRSYTMWFNAAAVITQGLFHANGQNTGADFSYGQLRVQYSNATSSTAVKANTWYHLAIVNIDSSTNYYYLNGNFFGSGPASNSPHNAAAVTLGYGPSGTYFSGSIAGVRLYSSSLTSAEVRTMVEEERTRFGADPGIVQVDRIYPAIGTTAGGTSVVIKGWNFTGASDVSFGGVSATSYTVDSSSQITAVAPAASAGTATVTVTVGGNTATLTNAYRYTATKLTSFTRYFDAGNINSLGANGTSQSLSTWANLLDGQEATLRNHTLPTGGSSSGWAGDGTSGNAYRIKFDGTDDYVLVEGNTAPKAVSLWFQVPSTAGTRGIFEIYGRNVYAEVTGGTVKITYASGTTLSSAISTNTWYHLVVTNDGTTTTGYLNGVSLGTITIAACSSAHFNLGYGNSTYFSGSLGAVRFYSANLTGGEVATIYGEEAAMFP